MSTKRMVIHTETIQTFQPDRLPRRAAFVAAGYTVCICDKAQPYACWGPDELRDEKES